MHIKNKIYNDYLNNQIDETDLIIRLDELQNKSVKSDGVIYTPWNIVSKMIDLVKPTLDTKILEPSCGHGIFIIGLLKYINQTYDLTGKNLLNWLNQQVVAIDISETTIYELKSILVLFFKKHFNLDLAFDDFEHVIYMDSLDYNPNFEFDLCIGNPPYIRTKNLDEAYLKKLRSQFKSCEKGNVDIYYAFIEKFIHLSKELCFITPNSFITNVSGKALREIMYDKLNYLIDFKEKLIFKDARTYTCIFKTLKQNSDDKIYYANDIKECFRIEGKNKIFVEHKKIYEEGLEVLSGLATLCDSVFIVKKDNNGKFIGACDGKQYEIEKEVVAPYLKLTKQKNNDFSKIDFMIYPYNKDKSIINEDDFKVYYPLAYTYLLANKQKLMQRDKGKTDKYEAWYAYGRKQGLHTIKVDSVISIPQMIGGECKTLRLNIGKLIQEFNKIVFTSGFLIPEHEGNKKIVELVLNDKFVDFVKTQGKPWPGKVESYYSLTAKQIRSVVDFFS